MDDMHPLESVAWRALDWALPIESCPSPDSLWNVPSILLSDTFCLRAVISRITGIGIVACAGLIKLPQILNVTKARSVSGLSIASIAIDTFGYTYNLAAHFRQHYPLSTYGDFAVLLLQNYALLLLCYAFARPPRTSRGSAVVAAFVALLALLCSPLCPLDFVRALTWANIPVVVFARIPQIYANYINGGTGALSTLTSWGVFLGATARIFTTLQDVDNSNILLGYIFSAALNGVIAFQVLWYAQGVREDGKKKA